MATLHFIRQHDFEDALHIALAAYGGMDYLRRVYEDRDDFTDISIECSQEHYDNLLEAMNDKSKNDLGKICNILRVVRDQEEIQA